MAKIAENDARLGAMGLERGPRDLQFVVDFDRLQLSKFTSRSSMAAPAVSHDRAMWKRKPTKFKGMKGVKGVKSVKGVKGVKLIYPISLHTDPTLACDDFLKSLCAPTDDILVEC